MDDVWASFNECIIMRPIFESTLVDSNQELTMQIYVGLIFIKVYVERNKNVKRKCITLVNII